MKVQVNLPQQTETQTQNFSIQILQELLEQMRTLISEAEKVLKLLSEKEKEERKFYSISEMARLTGMNANVI